MSGDPPWEGVGVGAICPRCSSLYCQTPGLCMRPLAVDDVARQRIEALERDYIHKDTLEAILKPLRDRVDELARRDTWLGEIEDARDSLAKDLCVMEVKLKQAEAAEIKYRDMWHAAEARMRLLEEVAAAASVILGDQGRKDCHADDPTASCWPNKRLRRALDAAGVK